MTRFGVMTRFDVMMPFPFTIADCSVTVFDADVDEYGQGWKVPVPLVVSRHLGYHYSLDVTLSPILALTLT